MSKPVAALTADNHLAQRAWAKYPGLYGDSYFGLQQIVDHCTANDLDLVMAGDIFDKTRPDPMTVGVMRRQVERMERNGLAVNFIQGQHELDRDHPWLKSMSWWATHVHRQQFGLGDGIVCYGIDWTPADTVQSEFDAIPPNTDLLISHQVWRDLMGPRIGESECQFADVPVVKMILTGDFHRHLTLHPTNKDGQKITVLSPGPPCMQSIDEDPRKQFFILCDDLSVHSVPLKVRQCLRFIINTKEDLEIFLTGNVAQAIIPQGDVPEHIAKNIIHISYKEDIPEVYARLTNAIGTNAHLFLAPVRQQQEVVTIDTERRRTLADGGLASCLELLVEPSSRIYGDVRSLLDSDNPTDRLKTLHTLFAQNFGTTNDRGSIRGAQNLGKS